MSKVAQKNLLKTQISPYTQSYQKGGEFEIGEIWNGEIWHNKMVPNFAIVFEDQSHWIRNKIFLMHHNYQYYPLQFETEAAKQPEAIKKDQHMLFSITLCSICEP